MSLASLAPSPSRRPSEADRRERILAAAERVFAEHGFHGATMQHVAEAASMSAGNLYRTFPSKEAIVEGLCACDQQERIDSFVGIAESGSVFAAFEAGLRDNFASRTRDKARLALKIWAEGCRNPGIAAMSLAVDADIIGKIARVIGLAKERGEAAQATDPEAVARLMFTYFGGLLKRQALEPAFDAEAETRRALGLLKALCSGAIHPDGQELSQ
jgi:TetR/AcrR family transcriptional regulator, repressor for uid operon